MLFDVTVGPPNLREDGTRFLLADSVSVGGFAAKGVHKSGDSASCSACKNNLSISSPLARMQTVGSDDWPHTISCGENSPAYQSQKITSLDNALCRHDYQGGIQKGKATAK